MTAFEGFRDFLAKCQELGEVEYINGADPYLEIGALFAINGQGPKPMLFMFDEIKGYPKGWRMATNIVGSRNRGRLASGTPLDLQGEAMQAWLSKRLDEKKLIGPEYVTSGAVLENVWEGDQVDLTKFPSPVWHELDAGPYIACASAVITQDVDGGYVTIGSYRSQMYDRNHIGLHTAHGHHGQVIRDHWFEQGKDCPVVIHVNGDPSLLAAAGANEPWGVGELGTAGWMRGEPVKVLKGKTGLPVPAGAEIVLEGYIMHPDHEPMRLEGTFGEASGYYQRLSGHESPVLRIDTVYFRNDPISAGSPPYKNVGGGAGGDGGDVAIMKEMKKAGFHDVRGIGHAGPFTVISVHQMYAGHGKRVADWFMSGINNRPPRMLVLVDDDIDPHDAREVFWAINTRIDPKESVHIYENNWASAVSPRFTPEQAHVPLEHAFTHSCMLLDALKPFAWKESFPPVNDVSPELRKRMIDKYSEYLHLEPERGGTASNGRAPAGAGVRSEM